MQRLRGVELWDELDMKTLFKYLPDENSNLSALEHWRAREVRNMFGMSPILVASGACYWGCVSPALVSRLQMASAKDIVNAISPPPPEPMSSCILSALARGRVLVYVSAPADWVGKLPSGC